VTIAAPWLIQWNIKQPNWNSQKPPLDVNIYETEIDRIIKDGKSLPLEGWSIYHPSHNYTGGQNSGSVDFAAVTICKPFDCGYGVRWVYSNKDRNVSLKLSSQIFAGNIFLTAWVNKNIVYQNEITSKKGKTDRVDVSLKEGWNRLAFKSNRITWQWQQSLELIPLAGDSLEDLRYSVVER